MKNDKFQSFDGTTIQCYLWNDVKKPKGVVQIAHGMAEHARRYDDFACFLNAVQEFDVGIACCHDFFQIVVFFVELDKPLHVRDNRRVGNQCTDLFETAYQPVQSI